jgi:hypothetical protein
MRHTWAIASRKDSLWVAWVYKNLIKNKSFWTMKVPQDCSWAWRKILKSREKAKEYVLNAIGNGENTLFWKDPWHPAGILIESFHQELRYDSTLHLNAKVAAIIDNGAWSIPTAISQTMADPWAQLEGIQIRQEEDDDIIWTPSQDGFYSLASTVDHMRSTRACVENALLIGRLWRPYLRVRGPEQANSVSSSSVKAYHYKPT